MVNPTEQDENAVSATPSTPKRLLDSKYEMRPGFREVTLSQAIQQRFKQLSSPAPEHASIAQAAITQYEADERDKQFVEKYKRAGNPQRHATVSG